MQEEEKEKGIEVREQEERLPPGQCGPGGGPRYSILWEKSRLARGWEERRFLHLGCTGMWLHCCSLSTRGQERPTHEARTVRAVQLPEGHLALAGGAGRSGERVGRSLRPSLLSETLSRRTSQPLGYTEPGKCCETGSPMQRFI